MGTTRTGAVWAAAVVALTIAIAWSAIDHLVLQSRASSRSDHAADIGARVAALEHRVSDIAALVGNATKGTRDLAPAYDPPGSFEETVAQIEGRMSALERQVAELDEAGRLAAAFPPASLVDELAEEQFAADEPANPPGRLPLQDAFASEAGSSDWAQSTFDAVTKAHVTDFMNGSFYAEYGGQLEADCRETVCRVDLTFETAAAQLGSTEISEMLALAELELLGLTGHAAGVGRITTAQHAGATPGITMFFDRREGSNDQQAGALMSSPPLVK